MWRRFTGTTSISRRLFLASGMNDGIETFRAQLQKELGLLIGPKDPLLALWVSQREFLEQNAAQQQKLLSEFQAALGKSQTAWSEQAKALAQQSLNVDPLCQVQAWSSPAMGWVSFVVLG